MLRVRCPRGVRRGRFRSRGFQTLAHLSSTPMTLDDGCRAMLIHLVSTRIPCL